MKRLFIIALGIGLLALTFLGISGSLPGGDGVVVSEKLPDGTEILVTQHYEGELGYVVGFYFRSPGKDWGWCYLGHQDPEWRSGRIQYDAETDTVLVWDHSELRGRWARSIGRWERPDDEGWRSPAPQELRNPPFEPTNG
jgi:hypothetical protein